MLALDLKGKRALVTGANSGIGEATALMLADAGADVVVNYLERAETAESVSAAIRAKGSRSFAVHADISDATQVSSMMARMAQEWGGIDILVNNAGIDGHSALGWEADVGAWRKVINVNLFGAFLCSREALRRMVAQRAGVIVNLSSVHEMITWGGFSAYTASKAAVSMLTKTLAQEAAPHGVRVIALAPGAVKTPINRNVWGDAAGLADLKRKIPMGRLAEPEEIARMVAVLASDFASYATGTTLFVDGGMTDFADFAHGG
ncbi:glucose 1-dehydrogenase [Devosia nitrariae]|uniref:Glucose-1-dehydrogenase n=1 Tax=Devosia nitrariae TaxID=2071872 RepID=A0ABQ5W8B3_9HYPH|nr:glucose 1-dehydrogenase [Devosia nitrariae]GLQ56190.1 glucose-1-dehydrogenase [Devosia nitrariae]